MKTQCCQRKLIRCLLKRQPVANYNKAGWLDKLAADPRAYRLAAWSKGPIEAHCGWKKRREWMAQDLPWPPKGKHVFHRFAPPAGAVQELAFQPEQAMKAK